MAYITSLKTRITRSARGELFNPLIYPFIVSTLGYGIGFVLFRSTNAVQASSLFAAMHAINPLLTVLWGALAITVIVVGLYVLVFDKPPIGKANCFVAWLLWLFAFIIYALSGGWLTLITVTFPNLFFWTWQYFSLAEFRRQDRLDSNTMYYYDGGLYDDELNPKDSKIARDDNRGVDEADRTPY